MSTTTATRPQADACPRCGASTAPAAAGAPCTCGHYPTHPPRLAASCPPASPALPALGQALADLGYPAGRYRQWRGLMGQRRQRPVVCRMR